MPRSFRIPSYYTLLVRSLSVLEGIALASDPNYKVGAPAAIAPAKRMACTGAHRVHAPTPKTLARGATLSMNQTISRHQAHGGAPSICSELTRLAGVRWSPLV